MLGSSWAEKALEIVQGNRRETLCVFLSHDSGDYPPTPLSRGDVLVQGLFRACLVGLGVKQCFCPVLVPADNGNLNVKDVRSTTVSLES